MIFGVFASLLQLLFHLLYSKCKEKRMTLKATAIFFEFRPESNKFIKKKQNCKLPILWNFVNNNFCTSEACNSTAFLSYVKNYDKSALTATSTLFLFLDQLGMMLLFTTVCTLDQFINNNDVWQKNLNF